MKIFVRYINFIEEYLKMSLIDKLSEVTCLLSETDPPGYRQCRPIADIHTYIVIPLLSFSTEQKITTFTK